MNSSINNPVINADSSNLSLRATLLRPPILYSTRTDGSVNSVKQIGCTTCTSVRLWESSRSSSFSPIIVDALAIYTDSNNCINTYGSQLHTPTVSPRRQLKQNNFLIWKLIMWLIKTRNINLDMIKVKAHTNDTFNEHADRLVKASANIKDPMTKMLDVGVTMSYVRKSSIHLSIIPHLNPSNNTYWMVESTGLLLNNG
ncbi:ribonuclease H-like domain-containing protein [Rhizophagus irregularis DAOM 181602=DAOM 197198]|nr:ribonuclease H-like domain-containing protein [Rhizophagus irregularis DAOM 181602=DAOM 197198]